MQPLHALGGGTAPENEVIFPEHGAVELIVSAVETEQDVVFGGMIYIATEFEETVGARLLVWENEVR